jgi:phosphoglucomutase
MRFDAMHAVTGPYAKAILEGLLGRRPAPCATARPWRISAAATPTPNLTHAASWSELLLGSDAYRLRRRLRRRRRPQHDPRARLLRERPSDSLAVLAANATLAPGYAGGLARAWPARCPPAPPPTVVARELGLPCYETPTGWKFFGNLLDAGRITLCGEESFGTGSDHVREKDGLWAVLFWLNILAKRREPVSRIMAEHWSRFGRHYYTRHDYEGVDSERPRR